MWSTLVDSLVYFPDRELYGDPADVGLAFTDLTIPTEDGERLHAWWVPTRKAPARGPGRAGGGRAGGPRAPRLHGGVAGGRDRAPARSGGGAPRLRAAVHLHQPARRGAPALSGRALRAGRGRLSQ